MKGRRQKKQKQSDNFKERPPEIKKHSNKSKNIQKGKYSVFSKVSSEYKGVLSEPYSLKRGFQRIAEIAFLIYEHVFDYFQAFLIIFGFI